MVKRIFVNVLVFVAITVLSAGYSFAEDSKSITVSAAMSLKAAFEEIAGLCKGKVVFNFGSSGALSRQIEAGAPADIFASASQKDMDMLQNKNMLLQGSRTNFAANEVVLIAPIKSNIAKSFVSLAGSDIKKIAVGSPKTVPAGRYAMEVLVYLKLDEKLKDKLVFGDHVRQVLDYTVRNEVDAAIVYATDAASRKDAVRVVEAAPAGSHAQIVYPIALIKGTKNQEAAKEFIAAVSSESGRAILKKYGFKAVK
jgi:molybdate transport system substrate-binding protein